jgi:hypothetical protein
LLVILSEAKNPRISHLPLSVLSHPPTSSFWPTTSSFWRSQNLCISSLLLPVLFRPHPQLRHSDRSRSQSHRERLSGGTPAFVLAVVCSCRHPERVFRTRRTPTNLSQPQPSAPFSHQTPILLGCHTQSAIVAAPPVTQFRGGTLRHGKPAKYDRTKRCSYHF